MTSRIKLLLTVPSLLVITVFGLMVYFIHSPVAGAYLLGFVTTILVMGGNRGRANENGCLCAMATMVIILVQG